MAIPLKDSLLVPYSQNWATRTTATPTDFGLTAAQAEAYVAVQSLYVDAYTTMMNARADGTWSESQTALKNATACSPAPPCTSPSMLMADAIALLMPTPQVIAIRAAAMEGACGP